MIPVLETERLILRGHTRADFDAHAAIWADPSVTRYIGGKPSTREESWGRFLRLAGLWPTLGCGYWAVFEKASGRLAAETGFADFKRELTPSFEGAPEQGWVVAPWAQGKGYATEAALASLAWADKTLPGDFVCLIDVDNAPSLRVAEKLGYREFARAPYKDDPSVLLRRKRP